MEIKQEDKLWTRSFILLFLISIVTMFSFTVTMTMLPVYAVKFGATLSIAGTLSGILH